MTQLDTSMESVAHGNLPAGTWENVLGVDQYLRKGYWIIGVFFVGFVGWASTMSLPAATLASGTVVVTGHNKVVQHIDGGIVEQIHVQDGDRVQENQPLLTLSNQVLQTTRDTLWLQFVRAQAAYARATSEALKLREMTETTWLTANGQHRDVVNAVGAEQEVLRQRLQAYQDRSNVIMQQVQQNEEETRGTIARDANLTTQFRSMQSELHEYLEFQAAGLVTRRQTFDLEHGVAELKVEIDDNRSHMAVLLKRSEELGAARASLESERLKLATEDRNRWRETAEDLQSKLTVAEGQLSRTIIRAPIDGTVVGSIVHTRGGVVAPGSPLMEIVPAQGGLIVRALVEPKDRESVKPGQSAQVRLTAFSQRFSQPLRGEVALISADQVVASDTASATPYFVTSIRLLDDPDSVFGVGAIHPGMQAEVVITTGERTVLEYLLQPLARGFNRSLRES